MQTSDGESIARHLAALGLSAGDDIVVHARLLSFGRILGGDPAGLVLSALRDAVGPEATIAAPTYVFGDAESVYDPARTPSTGMGPLSERIRQAPGARRSASPVHNHAAIGPKAALLAQTPATVSLGPGSDFELLRGAGFKLLLLGCRFSEGCTYMHHLEAMAGAPYREWVLSPKRVRGPDGAVQTVPMRYFARRDAGWVEDFDALEPRFAALDVFTAAPLPYGGSRYVDLRRLDAAGGAALAADPYAFVSPRAEAAGGDRPT